MHIQSLTSHSVTTSTTTITLGGNQTVSVNGTLILLPGAITVITIDPTTQAGAPIVVGGSILVDGVLSIVLTVRTDTHTFTHTNIHTNTRLSKPHHTTSSSFTLLRPLTLSLKTVPANGTIVPIVGGNGDINGTFTGVTITTPVNCHSTNGYLQEDASGGIAVLITVANKCKKSGVRQY